MRQAVLSSFTALHLLVRGRGIAHPLSLPTSIKHSNMAADGPAQAAKFFFEGETGRNTRGLLRLIILCTIAAAAVASRLFSVIRFESIIHECTQPINGKGEYY